MTTATTPKGPPATTHEAKRRYFDRYGDLIGGQTFEHVQRFLGRRMAEPITPQGWIDVAEETYELAEERPQPQTSAPAAPPHLGFAFRTRARIGDAEGDLTISADTLRDLVLTVRQLGSVGAIQLTTEAGAWQTTPDGRPICPKHKTPMKQREKQGDVWYSHNVGTENEPCYCKGYPGPDSPGWDR